MVTVVFIIFHYFSFHPYLKINGSGMCIGPNGKDQVGPEYSVFSVLEFKSLFSSKSLQKPLQKQLYISNPNGIALSLVP